jgi:hypothetical protein
MPLLHFPIKFVNDETNGREFPFEIMTMLVSLLPLYGDGTVEVARPIDVVGSTYALLDYVQWRFIFESFHCEGFLFFPLEICEDFSFEHEIAT